MEWLVSAGLLVAVAAWVAGVCHRLHLLRTEVRGAWADWLADTRCRNESLGELADTVSLLLPQGEMMPRTLRRLVADSERALRTGENLLWTPDEASRETEASLRHEAAGALRSVQQTDCLRGDTRLLSRCEQLLQALERQEQSGKRLHMATVNYNSALCEPPVLMIAQTLGFRHASER